MIWPPGISIKDNTPQIQNTKRKQINGQIYLGYVNRLWRTTVISKKNAVPVQHPTSPTPKKKKIKPLHRRRGTTLTSQDKTSDIQSYILYVMKSKLF